MLKCSINLIDPCWFITMTNILYFKAFMSADVHALSPKKKLITYALELIWLSQMTRTF